MTYRGLCCCGRTLDTSSEQFPVGGRRSQTLVNGRESIQMYRLRKALRKERELERDRRKAQVKGCRWTSARVTLHMHEEWCVAHSMSDALW